MIFCVVASLDRYLLNTDVGTSPLRILSTAATRIARVSGCLFLLFILGQLTWPQTSPGNSSAENADATGKAAEFAHPRELLKQGKHDEAIAELRQLSSSHPAMEGVSHELGVTYYKKSDYMAAAEQFRQALEKDPHHSEATQLLGLSYCLSGKPFEAIPLLERVQAWYPRANVDASYILGQCYI